MTPFTFNWLIHQQHVTVIFLMAHIFCKGSHSVAKHAVLQIKTNKWSPASPDLSAPYVLFLCSPYFLSLFLLPACLGMRLYWSWKCVIVINFDSSPCRLAKSWEERIARPIHRATDHVNTAQSIPYTRLRSPAYLCAILKASSFTQPRLLDNIFETKWRVNKRFRACIMCGFGALLVWSKTLLICVDCGCLYYRKNML